VVGKIRLNKCVKFFLFTINFYNFAATHNKDRIFMKNYEEIFQEYGGVAQMRTLMEAGVTYYSLRNLMEKGIVTKIKQGVYRLEDSKTPVDELVEVARLVPNGVYCLFSACAHYGLTSFVSGQHHLAIPKKSKVKLPTYPPIQLYYWTDVSYKLGITTVEINGNKINIYDVEKTVCDMIKFRNKVGIDTMKEVLHHYLHRKDRKITQLNNYARQMNIASVLSNYLEVLL
jgi:predicted transcriptional regulator of viral defense system